MGALGHGEAPQLSLMENEMQYTDDPKKAPVGTPFLHACSACGMDTGDILLRTRGSSPDRVTYTGPTRVALPETQCQFCQFLGMFFAQEGKEDGRKYGAGKIVDGKGKIVAMVPFHDGDEGDRDCQLADGTPFRWNHGTVVEANVDEKSGTLMKVLDPGLPEVEAEGTAT